MAKYVVTFDKYGMLRKDRHGEFKPHYADRGTEVELDEADAEAGVELGALKPMEEVKAERKAKEEAEAKANEESLKAERAATEAEKQAQRQQEQPSRARRA